MISDENEDQTINVNDEIGEAENQNKETFDDVNENEQTVIVNEKVTIAHAERSFSKLKLIKSYLRSSMSQERLSGLATLSIKKDLIEKLDYNSLISTFASQNARRVIFKWER